MATNGHRSDSADIDSDHPHHELCKRAFGSLVVDSVGLTQPDFRVLDMGTGDGYWLHDLRSRLRYPDEADLLGTDTTIMPAEQRPFAIPHNMRFLAQEPTDSWPEDIHGYFDLVHNRRVLAFSGGSFERAAEITARLLRLVKPGGTILLVDCCLEPGPMASHDTPSHKLFTMLGNALSSQGIEGNLGGDLPAILDVASQVSGVRLADVGLKKSESRIGEGADGDMRDLGMAWLEHLKGVKSKSRSKADLDRMDRLVDEVIEEARTTGFNITWYAACAKRSGGDAGGAIEMPA
ncbi:putative S-adenosyl-L-methionine-dependent methyltransferase [Septoria linicola]|nr:putative S-adenosyl-L-methionine-dependent methyltransferase [Septoria linicola]